MVWDSARAYNSCNVTGEGVNEGVKSHFIGTNRWLKTPPKQAKPAEPHWTERLPKMAQRSVAAKSVGVPKKVNIVPQHIQPSAANDVNNNSFDSEQQSWPSLPATKPSPRRTDIELLANGWEVVRDEDFHELEKQQVEQEEGGDEEQAENDSSASNQQQAHDTSGFFNWIWCETKAPDCVNESGSCNSNDEVVAETDHPLADPIVPASSSYADALKR